MRKFKSMSLIMILLIIINIIPVAVSAQSANNSSYNRRMENECESENEYEKLNWEIFDEDKKEINKAYPDYYGGSYIDDTGELIVQVTQNDKEIISIIKDYTDNPDINIMYVNNSYNELEALQDYIVQYYENNYNKKSIKDNILSELLSSITIIAISNKDNSVVVGIDNLSNEKINRFREYISDSDPVIFIEGDPASPVVSVIPGFGVNIGNVSGCSAGFRCMYTNSSGTTYYGFVTAGHAYSAIYADTTAYNALGIAIGKYNKGGTSSTHASNGCDAVFYQKYSDSVTLSTTTTNGYTLTASVASPSEGKTIYKEGITTGLTAGTVTYASVSYAVGGFTYNDMMYTSASCNSGDSGGIVYYNSGTSQSPIYKVVGIVAAKDNTSSSAGNMYVSKASNISSSLSVYLY